MICSRYKKENIYSTGRVNSNSITKGFLIKKGELELNPSQANGMTGPLRDYIKRPPYPY
jgi:hypothetical protein